MISDLCIYGVPCRACNLRHNHTLLPYEMIDQRGFTHIRLAHDCNLRPVILALVCRLL